MCKNCVCLCVSQHLYKHVEQMTCDTQSTHVNCLSCSWFVPCLHNSTCVLTGENVTLVYIHNALYLSASTGGA